MKFFLFKIIRKLHINNYLYVKGVFFGMCLLQTYEFSI